MVLPFAGERSPINPRAGKFNGRKPPTSHLWKGRRLPGKGELQPPRPFILPGRGAGLPECELSSLRRCKIGGDRPRVYAASATDASPAFGLPTARTALTSRWVPHRPSPYSQSPAGSAHAPAGSPPSCMGAEGRETGRETERQAKGRGGGGKGGATPLRSRREPIGEEGGLPRPSERLAASRCVKLQLPCSL